MATPKQMIRDLMEYGGLSQKEIGLAIEYNATGMSRLIAGDIRSMRYEIGKRLEDFYASKLKEIERAKRAKLEELQASLQGSS
jgi:DNA transposition AAA+ family ATPase